MLPHKTLPKYMDETKPRIAYIASCRECPWNRKYADNDRRYCAHRGAEIVEEWPEWCPLEKQ